MVIKNVQTSRFWGEVLHRKLQLSQKKNPPRRKGLVFIHLLKQLNPSQGAWLLKLPPHPQLHLLPDLKMEASVDLLDWTPTHPTVISSTSVSQTPTDLWPDTVSPARQEHFLTRTPEFVTGKPWLTVPTATTRLNENCSNILIKIGTLIYFRYVFHLPTKPL